ncbi:MAG: hypothetical protein CUN56_03455 [Phototrophicales bacterium]|nr:MAG: hypothetical protein CUN56_03455 [Phototrophicales bacterium]
MVMMRFLMILIMGWFAYPLVAQETTPEPDTPTPDIPLVIYGNEPALRNNILITIDDCIDEVLTRQMFEFLVEHDIKAVFFPLGSELIEHDPTLWQEIIDAGFEIGYHTRYHNEGMTIPELEEDFAAFQADLRDVLDDPDYTIRYVRPPYGVWDRNWLEWAEANNLVTVRWNLVTRFDLTMAYFEAVLRHENGGGIVLVHPRPTDMNWLENHIDDVMALTTEAGEPYRIVNLTQAFSDDEEAE